jgi:hypothetical protein
MATERALEMTRLTQQSWDLTITRRSDGTPLNLTGFFAAFVAKRQPDFVDAAAEFVIKSTDSGSPINFTSPANGQLTVTVTKAKTTSIPRIGLKLYYELKLVSAGAIPLVPLYGSLAVLPNIYDAEA